MPLLSRVDLEDTLRRLPPQAIRRVLRHGVVPVAWQPDHVHYAICGPKGAGYARRHGLAVVARIASSDFHQGVRRVWGRKILAKATNGLSATRPKFSARKRVTPAQGAAFIILALSLALSSIYFTASALWVAASAALGLFFLSVITLRLCCLFSIPATKAQRLGDPNDADLPTYSILVPVFRETSVLSQLLRGLSCLNYPVEKLEIKIIVEEFDTNLRRALEKFDLPPHIEVIVVPQGSPQTKPRALNYALQFCHGSLLTIYDAEDVPEPNQLRDVAREFLRADNTLACLQALTAGIFFSALFHPFLMALTAWLLVVNPFHVSVTTMLNLEVFVLGYGVAMLAGAKALRQRGLKGWWFTIATMPFYWLLMSVAAWMALWQLIFAPFKWNKTELGLSKLQA